MTHDKDDRFTDYNKPIDFKDNKKKECKKQPKVLPKNSKEDLHLSKPISKESAQENVLKNENPFVTKYYQEENESPIPKTESEEEILNSIIEEDLVENFENNEIAIRKFKDATKCASHLLPFKEDKNEISTILNKHNKELFKNMKKPVDIIKCDPSRIDNWQMFKKVEERIGEKLDEDGEFKTIKEVFDDSIIDFKKLNPKLNKEQKNRIQGKFKTESNVGSSFSFFNKNEFKKNNDLLANESQFEYHSNI